MSKLFGWIGDKNRQDKGSSAAVPERAARVLEEAVEAGAANEVRLATRLCEESIAIYHQLGLKSEEAAAHHVHAGILVNDSAFTAAFDSFNAAIKIYRSLGQDGDLAVTLRDCGEAYSAYSHPEAAAEHLNESLQLFQQQNDQAGIASCLESLGRAARHDEDADRALDFFERALAAYTAFGLMAESAICNLYLSAIAVDVQDYVAAAWRYTEAVERYRELNANTTLADALAEFGAIPFTEKIESACIELLDAALIVISAARTVGSGSRLNLRPAARSSGLTDPSVPSPTANDGTRDTGGAWRQEAAACLSLAPVAYGQDQAEMAHKLVDRALELADSNGDKMLRFQALYQAGAAAYRFEKYDVARKHHKALAEEADLFGSAEFEAAGRYGYALAAYAERDIQAASASCDMALDLFKRLGSVQRTARALTLYGSLLHEQGDTETAIKVLQESLGLCRRAEDPAGMASALMALGEAARDENPGLARACLDECIDLDEIDDLQTSTALQSLAELALTQGELAEAYELSCRVVTLMKEYREGRSVAAALECCGHVAAEWGDIEAATLMLSKADSIRLRAGSARAEGLQERFLTNIRELNAEIGPVDFQRMWAEGEGLTLEEIAGEAEALLEDIEPEAEGEEMEEEVEE